MSLNVFFLNTGKTQHRQLNRIATDITGFELVYILLLFKTHQEIFPNEISITMKDEENGRLGNLVGPMQRDYAITANKRNRQPAEIYERVTQFKFLS